MFSVIVRVRKVSPHVSESMKVLDFGSRPLDSGFQLSGFRNPYIVDSGLHTIVDFGFQTIMDSGFQSLDSGFRIPTAKLCWIPDSLTWGE